MITNMISIPYPKPIYDFDDFIKYLHTKVYIYESRWGYFLYDKYQLLFHFREVEVRIEQKDKNIIADFIKAIEEFK